MARIPIGNVYPTDDYLLARCAPAGFGLGVKNGHDCTDCNEAILNGTYYIFGESATNHPGNSMQYGCMDVKRRGNYITQIVHYDYYEAKRFSKDGGETWGAWEWVNPPMQVGVEYRTTERWQGKPVYYKVVDFGGLPNATTATVPIGAENIEWAFLDLSKSWAGPASDLTTNYVSNSSGITEMIVNSGKISITTNASMTGTLAYIAVKYTKKT